jgi:two-component system response regulator AtoC
VVRLLRDRYAVYDGGNACDLATGEVVRADGVSTEEPVPVEVELAPLMEVLDDGRDGEPRWIAVQLKPRAQAGSLVRRVAALARQKGLVPMLIDLYERFRDRLADDLSDRALLLIADTSTEPTAASFALMRAAAHSRRPHVLLTLRPGANASRSFLVREAHATYGAPPHARSPRSQPLSPDVARHLERAQRAGAFQNSGRHAAAERLLRDVAGALVRRGATGLAARTLVTLARVLLERGRATDAGAVCEEAAGLAEAGQDEHMAVTARLWEVAARTDAGRLPDAESLCRAVLLAGALSTGQAAWARGLLARTLRWQRRLDDAARVEGSFAPGESGGVDDMTRAYAAAGVVRRHLDAGEIFDAGRAARALVAAFEGSQDPVAPVIAQTTYLRVLAAMGDLTLAEQCFSQVVSLAARARTPLRIVRARLVWYDALRRAGEAARAAAELRRLERVRRGATPLLQRAIDERLAIGTATAVARVPPPPPSVLAPAIALSFVRVVQDEATDKSALQRALEQVAREVGASRVELLSADAGPVSALFSVGTGLRTHLGSRVLDAGILLPAEVQQGGREIGVPVRHGTRLLAALVARWPLDREPRPSASEVMQLAAAVAAPRLDTYLADARETARAATAIPELVGISRAMADVRRAIARAATAPFTVVIEGESGAGKELVARAIHQLGPRRERRFCDINCAALPDDLLESELFGHVRGAFTGAVADRAGLFEDADGGTLFLDELPDLSPRGQAKLLRVVQQQEVRRIGETFSRAVDVRLVTATNRDMQVEVAEGRFRRDLLYRLDVIRIQIPPLRDRPDDVPALAEHFWRAAAPRVSSQATLSHGVYAALTRYHWPGNVRELQNVIAALAVAAPSRGTVKPTLLPAAIAGAAATSSRRLADARAQVERRCIEVALARAGGNRSKAAAELGLSRQGLMKVIARLGRSGLLA